MDVEIRRRMHDSEYNISRLKGEIRSEHEFQKRSGLELRMEVRKSRDEASQKEVENRTIHNEFVLQQRHNAIRGHDHQMPAARRTPPNPRPASAGRDRLPMPTSTGQAPKAASETPSDQWTRGHDPWSATRTLGGNLEFYLIIRNQYQRSREFADYERTQRGEPPLGSPDVIVNTPCTPGTHLGRGYNAG